MQAFEDIQPNELRPSHKGRNVVPIIRTSRPSDHGRATQVMRSRGSAQSAASTSQPRTPDPDPRFNDRLYNVMHAAGNERPKKRRRIDTINPEPNNDHARKHNPVITISVPLPPNCLSGAFRCHNHRRSWLKSKTRQIQHEHGVTILSHSYEGSDALFNCRVPLLLLGTQSTNMTAAARKALHLSLKPISHNQLAIPEAGSLTNLFPRGHPPLLHFTRGASLPPAQRPTCRNLGSNSRQTLPDICPFYTNRGQNIALKSTLPRHNQQIVQQKRMVNSVLAHHLLRLALRDQAPQLGTRGYTRHQQ
ncbi:uncharacterized protein C8Q71DRAFT_28200 [Rhodofomes roseus]|uniref:Uncharacterized protein n=1 Tax=Rhodofomes roseus TaxID=34475 RepID=A0ABQ8KYU7_9APHY|nr:uncharacterized protein C8Q71DRAFT_28200 [Rhodofomes roseus]KAH9844060.1 hypothetical protein C8Q71DRAFT_28200 [Rhodofomes roseus]